MCSTPFSLVLSPNSLISKHKIIIHQIDDISMQQDDLARSYLKKLQLLPSKDVIFEQIDELGLKLVPVDSCGKLRSCLSHFGKELYVNDLVEVKSKAGLTFNDVIIKNM